MPPKTRAPCASKPLPKPTLPYKAAPRCCLHPVQTQLTVDRDFRFVADEAAALAEDDVVEEDLLVLSSEFDLLTLLEDELLMALPLVPMHDTCESEHMPTSNAENAAAQEKPNPFAALAALKRKPGD